MRQLFLLIAGSFCLCLHAQKAAILGKPALDTNALRNWSEPVNGGGISDDGAYIWYGYGTGSKDIRIVVIQSSNDNWKREIKGPAYGGNFTKDSKQFIVKGTGDSLFTFKLGTNQCTFLLHVKSYTLTGARVNEKLIYQRIGTDSVLIVRDLNTGAEQQYKNVKSYKVTDDGENLLLIKYDTVIGSNQSNLCWIDLKSQTENAIRKASNASNFVINSGSNHLVFVVETKQDNQSSVTIWHYKKGMDTAEILINNESIGIDSGLAIDNESPVFSKNGDRLFFKLKTKSIATTSPDAVQVDIWNHKDFKLQTEQMDHQKHLKPEQFAATFNFKNNRIVRLQQEGESIAQADDAYTVVWKGNFDFDGIYRYPVDSTNKLYILSNSDGSKKVVKKDLSNSTLYVISPTGKWLVYFDNDKENYFSYEMATGTIRNITKSIPVSLANEEYKDIKSNSNYNVGIAGWLEDDSSILIYDEYDIWQVDPRGIKTPINLTRSYGYRNRIRLRLWSMPDLNSFRRTAMSIPLHEPLIVSGFSEINKHDGLYAISLNISTKPNLLTEGPWYMNGSAGRNQSPDYYFAPKKAANANTWLIMRQSFDDAPNFYITHDLTNYKRVSDIQPQKEFNWLVAELLHYKKADGDSGTAILYKPENFDPAKKYPIVFQYYEHLSNELYFYHRAGRMGIEINIPEYVSNGYIVCIPDIKYHKGYPGSSAFLAVMGAANYLSGQSWVDVKHMGLDGHSFGGYETNYLITHTHLFAAASEAAGPVDFISGYGGLYAVFLEYFWFENGQGRIGATLWQRPDLYIENSPVFKLDQVTTPLLMMHNRRDDRVPFSQAIELFTGLRRLGKPVWMLQYDHGSHVVNGKDAWDYQTRMRQFFDHYLKGAPPPKWMTEGVPARMKGIDTGLELDTSGKKP